MVTSKKAFTILELVIAMGITVALFSLGLVGILNLRRSLELRNGYNDIASKIRLIQNQAKNSVELPLDLCGGACPASVYALDFSVDNTYTVEGCIFALFSTERLNCEVQEADAKADRFAAIEIVSTCNKIGFARRTGNIVHISESNQVSEDIQCSLRIKHRDLSNTLTIDIDTEANLISYE